MYKKLTFLVGVTVLCLLLSCGTPKAENVRGDFLKEHPNYEIISVGVGEGDASAAYFHIKYRKPGNAKLYEDVWQYLKAKDGEWVLMNKETLNTERKE